ncbi:MULTISPECIES: hypothetical protein [unclassified Novosphingobium]|uniref:hypothetical protein n=1 Tax=unclassified Novosphingobium TaxID=2644732 RepID=UPI00135AEBF4|nr:MULTISPECIES: hypothetical protein [unclassified Novosphingobium]
MKTVTIAAWMLGTCAVLPALPAHATTMFPQAFTCPIGGEKFESQVIASYSSFGSRPDGRPYGTLPVMPMTECPTNGFVLIGDTLSKAEITALTPVVASPEYQAMRQTETPHFRAWYLMKAISRPPEDLADALLQASWETDRDAARKARYQQLFVTAADAVARGSDKDAGRKWFFLNLRAVNAQRELGAFEAAWTRLDVLSRSIDLAGYGPDEADESRDLNAYLITMGTLLAEKNAYFEPAGLVPSDVALQRCDMTEPPLTPSETTVCDSRELADRRKEIPG